MKLMCIFIFFSFNIFSQEIESGNVISSSVLNDKFNDYKKDNLGYGYMPIGSITPFHKNTGSGLNIPEGWVECNGNSYPVKLNGPLDPDGNGLYTVPNLNNNVYASGKGRYLRGGSLSGNFNASTAWDDNGADYTHGSSGSYYGATFGYYSNTENGSKNSYVNGSGLNANDFRFQVAAMTVVYIMRIK